MAIRKIQKRLKDMSYLGNPDMVQRGVLVRCSSRLNTNKDAALTKVGMCFRSEQDERRGKVFYQ